MGQNVVSAELVQALSHACTWDKQWERNGEQSESCPHFPHLATALGMLGQHTAPGKDPEHVACLCAGVWCKDPCPVLAKCCP